MGKYDEKLLEQMESDFKHYATNIAKLLSSKNKDYGPGNIAEFGRLGILVRLSDKIERLKNLYSRGILSPQHEAIEDTLKDIAGYAIIGLMIEHGRWPEKVFDFQKRDGDIYEKLEVVAESANSVGARVVGANKDAKVVVLEVSREDVPKARYVEAVVRKTFGDDWKVAYVEL